VEVWGHQYDRGAAVSHYLYSEELRARTFEACAVCGNEWAPKTVEPPSCSSRDAMGFEPLVGCWIHEVRIDEEHLNIAFEVCGGRLNFCAEGDCCSSSWIENVQNAEHLKGSKIVSVEDVEMPSPDQSDHELLQAYGLRIHLADRNGLVRPPFLIEHRNSSNGYYGGSLIALEIDEENWKSMRALDADF
jgi:hypothetical protein